MAKEKNLWLLMRKNLPHIHLQRIETGLTGSGVPDVNGCAKGKEFWVRAMHGGQVFVLARKHGEIKLFHVDGLEGAKQLVEGGYKSNALLTLNIPYDWEALTTALLS